ncbi:hypothetical protein V9T40_013695 [Parthenolecanium corni]|uniref:Uncharacterized protein n=1 Tax=Parthenolecanium corni TaxID=536013 RepID=A0AAN9Y1L4_9HEMI
MGTRCGLHNTKIQKFFLVIYELNVLALILKVSGSVLDSAGRQDPSYSERTPMPRKPSKLARKTARRLKVELITPRIRLTQDDSLYYEIPRSPVNVDLTTPPPSPPVAIAEYAVEVELETEVRAAAASLNMYGRLDAGLQRVGGSELSGSSPRRDEADLVESQASGLAEGEVAENNHPRSSSELGLMGL